MTKFNDKYAERRRQIGEALNRQSEQYNVEWILYLQNEVTRLSERVAELESAETDLVDYINAIHYDEYSDGSNS